MPMSQTPMDGLANYEMTLLVNTSGKQLRLTDGTDEVDECQRPTYIFEQQMHVSTVVVCCGSKLI